MINMVNDILSIGKHRLNEDKDEYKYLSNKEK